MVYVIEATFGPRKSDQTKIKLELSDATVEKIYRARLREYRLLDARDALLDNYGDGRDEKLTNETKLKFRSSWGFHLKDALNKDSEDYLLEDIVERFEDRFDCNIAENAMWEQACADVLEEWRILRQK